MSYRNPEVPYSPFERRHKPIHGGLTVAIRATDTPKQAIRHSLTSIRNATLNGYIFFKKSVWKDFKSIPDKDLKKIMRCIDLLSKDPRHSSCKKLSSQEKYRIRQGRYRIIYSIQDRELTVWIVKVGQSQKCVSLRSSQ